MLDLIGRSLGPRIEVRVEMAADLPAARVDPNQLEVALLNLAVNARDAMPDGGTILISGTAADGGEAQGVAQGRYVCLAVADDGFGMTPETLARAVEPFFTTKAIGKGTGLGLSMVHGLAAQSGGQLTLESAPGKGTTATLWLPAAGILQVESVAPAPCEAGVPAQPLSVLLVDDDDLVRAGAAAMLEAIGHSVVQVSSGTQALEHLASGEAFDVLVTDQRMPGMMGVDLIRRARFMRPGLPAVLITGYTDSVDPHAGDVPLLAKPFRAAELALAVAEAVKR
jgi:CheY-like chemotaxis protein